MDCAEQIHDGRGRRAAHAKVDDRDVVGRRARHRFVATEDGDAMPLGKQLHVVVEIREQDVVAEFAQRHAGVAREPVFDDLATSFHGDYLANEPRAGEPAGASRHTARFQNGCYFAIHERFWRRCLYRQTDGRSPNVFRMRHPTWSLHEPSVAEVDAFLTRQREADFSYADRGASREGAPAGYNLDHNRRQIGAGEMDFAAACAALRRWHMFP